MTADTDLISVTEILRAMSIPVTITYDAAETFLPWKVEMGDQFMARDISLGSALFRCSTMYQAWTSNQEARDGER